MKNGMHSHVEIKKFKSAEKKTFFCTSADLTTYSILLYQIIFGLDRNGSIIWVGKTVLFRIVSNHCFWYNNQKTCNELERSEL